MKYSKLFEARIDELEFDPHNPRLPKKLSNAADKEIIEWMLADASLIDLVASIATNGYFPGEPLLVIENKKIKKYTVIEGNRRLAACKILNNPKLVDSKKKTLHEIMELSSKENIPLEVPAFLFTARTDILAYLGYRHVTGVKSWGTLPKAKYLHELLELDHSKQGLKEKCKSLARQIGSKGDYVLRLLTSYQLYLILEKNKFFKIPNLSEDTIDFSNLVDAATRYGNISEHLHIDFESEDPLKNLDKEHFSEVVDWLFRRDEENRSRIGDNRNIRVLNTVINHTKALTAFRKGADLKEALLLTEEPDQIFEKSLKSSHKHLEIAYGVSKNIHKQTIANGIKEIGKIRSAVDKIDRSIS
jgi:hypothetical protein